MIKYLSTIVLTVALCCACDGEDFSADPTLMPPATQTGANTFGCLIDGWIYTGQRYGPDHKASYYPAYNEDEKATVHVYVWVDDNTSISFNIIDPKEKNITVYSDIEKMDNDQTIYTDAVFKDPDFVIAPPKNLHQRVWRFSDALPSTLSECIHPCSEVA